MDIWSETPSLAYVFTYISQDDHTWIWRSHTMFLVAIKLPGRVWVNDVIWFPRSYGCWFENSIGDSETQISPITIQTRKWFIVYSATTAKYDIYIKFSCITASHHPNKYDGYYQNMIWDCGKGNGDTRFLQYTSSKYRKTSSISRTKSQNLTVSCILLELSSLNPLKPDVELRMKM